MDEQRQERIDRPALARRRADWIKPEVDRFLVGGAEASDGADTDGALLS